MNKPIRPQIIPEQFARYEGQDVIPLKGREKRPLDNGWQRQSYDPARVIAKATKNNTNMGLRLGADDLVIDYDPRNDRTGDSFDRLVKDLGLRAVHVSDRQHRGRWSTLLLEDAARREDNDDACRIPRR